MLTYPSSFSNKKLKAMDIKMKVTEGVSGLSGLPTGTCFLSSDRIIAWQNPVD